MVACLQIDSFASIFNDHNIKVEGKGVKNSEFSAKICRKTDYVKLLETFILRYSPMPVEFFLPLSKKPL